MRGGQVGSIPLGLGGVSSDDPQTLILPTSIIYSRNINMKSNLIEKERGSSVINPTAFDGPVKAAIDYFPKTYLQRLVVVTGTGKTYRMRRQGDISEIAATGTDTPATIGVTGQVFIMEAGNESAGRNKKLFVFNGQNPVQVISGDSLTRSNITTPAADWSGTNQPTFGFMHRSRPIVFGNQNDPHRIYIGKAADHEVYAGSDTATISVFPGEGERLAFGFTYKGRAFLVKSPDGIYFLDDSVSADPADWTVKKLMGGFGVSSAFAGAEILDDFLLANSTGSVTSLVATQALGDVKAADVLTNLKIEDFIRNIVSSAGNKDRLSLYYAEKKLALFAYRNRSGATKSGILSIDYSGQSPRANWSDKDQVNCLTLRQDIKGIKRPIYGADDGYVYQMDHVMRNVGGASYRSEFHTANLDFSQLGADAAEKQKRFIELGLVYVPTGRWSLYVEVFIDGVYRETIPYRVSYGKVLGGQETSTEFKLDHTRLTGKVPRKKTMPLHGKGQRIGFRLYHEGLNENFKLLSMRLRFKVLGQAEQADDE